MDLFRFGSHSKLGFPKPGLFRKILLQDKLRIILLNQIKSYKHSLYFKDVNIVAMQLDNLNPPK